jgi:cell division septal protein FtsQ
MVTPLGRARRVAEAAGTAPAPRAAGGVAPASGGGNLRAVPVKSAPARGEKPRQKKAAAPAGSGNVVKALKAAPGAIRKLASLCLYAVIATAALAAVSAGCLYAYYSFSDSDYFLIKRHDIRGIFRVSRQEVLAAAGLDRPVNTLTFDTQAAVRGLKSLPWVEEADISRAPLPDGITVRVTEYRPRAVVALDRLYYLDAKGRPFKSLEPGENPDKPIVSGFTLDELLNEGPLAGQAVSEVFDLMDVLDRRADGWRLEEISEIRRDPDIGVTLFTRSSGIEARLGFGPFAEKVARLGRVTDRLRSRGHLAGVSHMNLECTPRVTVRWERGAKPPDVGVPEEEEGVPGYDGEVPPSLAAVQAGPQG